jgi:nucleotide-binding universal stress UspA family protein
MYTRMVIPLDGTRRSGAVVPHAIHAAKNLGCGVMLIRVLPRTAARHNGNEERECATVDDIAPEVADAERYLKSVARRFDKTGIMTWTEVRGGDPAVEILKAAVNFDADVIAMATRSRRGLQRLVFGSVADQVLKDSEIPVLLITAG